MRCEVPVGWTCKFAGALSGEQSVLALAIVFGLIAGVIALIAVLVYLDGRHK